jgi:hypothetical protein
MELFDYRCLIYTCSGQDTQFNLSEPPLYNMTIRAKSREKKFVEAVYTKLFITERAVECDYVLVVRNLKGGNFKMSYLVKVRREDDYTIKIRARKLSMRIMSSRDKTENFTLFNLAPIRVL